jgi:hypothetical protein
MNFSFTTVAHPLSLMLASELERVKREGIYDLRLRTLLRRTKSLAERVTVIKVVIR